VAAVNGPAVGAGVNLALAADLRVCSTTAGFTSGFAAIGLHPGGGHLHLVARTSNAAAAAAMGVFARSVDAAQAVRLGLVWDVVEPSRLRATVDEATEHLARDPDLARALASSFRESVRPLDQWDRAIAIELERQVWSLDRTPKES
jgi:enoyl-CoA hydratase